MKKYLQTGIKLLIITLLFTTHGMAQNKVFWSDVEKNVVGEYDLDANTSTIIKDDPGDVLAEAFAADTVGKRAFWVRGRTLRMGSLTENTAETLYELPEFGTDFDIEYNYESNSVFVSELEDMVIYRYDLDTGTGSVLLDQNDGIGLPFNIVSSSTHIYWSSGDDFYRAGLDGSNPESFATADDRGRPLRLAVDEANGWLYWADNSSFAGPASIKRFKLEDGSDEETMVSFGSDNEMAEGLIVIPGEDAIYWINSQGAILSADADGATIDTVASGLARGGADFNNLELDTDTGAFYWSQQDIYTLGFQESDERLLYQSVTPTYIKYDSDADILFYSDGSQTFSRNLSTGEEIQLVDVNQRPVGGAYLEIDSARDLMFWSDLNYIYQTDYGVTTIDTVSAIGGFLTGITVDPVDEQVYYTDNGSSSFGNLIRVAYNGTDADTLVSFDLNYPRGLEIDSVNRKLYWSASGQMRSSEIIMSELDGTDRTSIFTAVPNGGDTPYELAASPASNQLFWADRGTDTVWMSDLNGDNPVQLSFNADIDDLFGIDLFITDMVTSASISQERPEGLALSQNYPNPFNPSTTIEYTVPKAGTVTLEVFNMVGKRVAILENGAQKSAGKHLVNFDASDLSSGMYIYRLTMDGNSRSKRLVLIK